MSLAEDLAELAVGIQLVVVQPEMHPDDNANWWDAALRSGEVEIQGMDDLVKVATRACIRSKNNGGVGKIRELIISGHGNSGGFWVGNDWIDLETIGVFAGQFTALSVLLNPDANVILLHCAVGQADPLLLLLSGFLGGVRVHAGLFEQPPGFKRVVGDKKMCVFVRGCRTNGGVLNFENNKKQPPTAKKRNRTSGG